MLFWQLVNFPVNRKGEGLRETIKEKQWETTFSSVFQAPSLHVNSLTHHCKC